LFNGRGFYDNPNDGRCGYFAVRNELPNRSKLRGIITLCNKNGTKKKGFMGKLGELIKKAIDCCIE